MNKLKYLLFLVPVVAVLLFSSFSSKKEVKTNKEELVWHTNINKAIEIAKKEDKPLFLIELQYVGLCQIENVPDEMLAGLLMIQTPTLLFPYARQILSDVTSNAGFPPLFLQPVDFAALYHNQQANVGVVGNA